MLIEMNSRAIAIVRRIMCSRAFLSLIHFSCVEVAVDDSTTGSHFNTGNLDCFGPAGVIVGHALKGVGDTQDNIFGEEVS